MILKYKTILSKIETFLIRVIVDEYTGSSPVPNFTLISHITLSSLELRILYFSLKHAKTPVSRNQNNIRHWWRIVCAPQDSNEMDIDDEYAIKDGFKIKRRNQEEDSSKGHRINKILVVEAAGYYENNVRNCRYRFYVHNAATTSDESWTAQVNRFVKVNGITKSSNLLA
ncbi:hypothetical protein CONCODRAFT_3932 [Conidiobolus coronatus NRRL 28638]|uniref:Uncharacterized protein n=1 Tax=Conidiobolus coronatus (strain ATCC 28846 / CBS 209.66 / NRRL 28638) TaxID=796925 RepID=A0A137PE56_CONC2|nr:hypothetical protein CONCODRAFT_3932 [Conidiobolus coronatus NRRL 28638]|eukprot:KXN73252.1 hypothetical protein CONCODRAFT_3932 [Conidiobolus coronatus NRRL 28638]